MGDAETTSRESTSGRRVIVRVGVALVGLAAVLWFYRSANPLTRLNSPAADLRIASDYQVTIDPQPSTQTVEALDDGSLTVTTNAGTIRITYPNVRTAKFDTLRPEVRIAESGFRLPVGRGSVALDYVGIGYGTPEDGEESASSVGLRGHFFEPDGKPFSEGEFAERAMKDWERQIRYETQFPEVKFGLRLEGDEDFKMLGLRLFDGRSQASVFSGGMNYGSRGNGRFEFTTEITMWHVAPLEVMVDLAYGPVQEFEGEPAPGTLLSYPGGEVLLSGLIAGEPGGWSSGTRENESYVELPIPEPRDDRALAVFLCSPTSHQLPIEIQLLDGDGNELPRGGGETSARMMIFEVRAGVDDIRRVRLRYYPNLVRLVFRLDACPGLPPENSGVSDLFDVQVPYLVIRDASDMRRWLGRVLQLKVVNQPTGTIPLGFFPRRYYGTTPREVVADYHSLFPPRHVVKTNRKAQTLTVELSRLGRYYQAVAQWLKKRFR